MIVPSLITLARKVSTHLLDATSTWDSTTEVELIVPAGKRWILQNLFVWRTQNATLTIRILNASDQVLAELVSVAAAVSGVAWPQGTGVARSQNSPGIIMDAGEKLSMITGAAQDASAYYAYSYLEVDI